MAAALHSWGIPTQLIDMWLQQADSDHAIFNASAHTEKLIQDCMHNTFFTVDGVPGVCHTTTGTRPGDPLGDLLFNLIMRLVLHDMHAQVKQASGATWLGAPAHCSSFAEAEDIPPHAYFDVSFVDDVAVAIHAESLPEVECLIKLVVESFHTAARARGLDVNFSQGKTEVLWDILGKGSKALKERLHDFRSMAFMAPGREHLQPQSVSSLQTFRILDADWGQPPKGNRPACLLSHAKLGMPGTLVLPQTPCWLES